MNKADSASRDPNKTRVVVFRVDLAKREFRGMRTAFRCLTVDGTLTVELVRIAGS